MKYRNKSEENLASKVYQYGSPLKFRLHENEDVVEQLRIQNRFWNDLVEVFQRHREKYRQTLEGLDDELSDLVTRSDQLKEEIEGLRGEIRARRKAARSGKKAECSDLRERIRALRDERKPLIERIKPLKAEVRLRNKDVLHELSREHNAEVKALRQRYAAEGLYWGTYNAVLQGYDVARKRSMKEGSDLKFHRFDGTGTLTCQIPHGITIRDVFEGVTNMLQIDPVPESAWDKSTPRGTRRVQCRTIARMRIGSNDDKQRSPKWLEIPIVMHRPVPEHARIKSASISFKKIADRITPFLNLTVNEPASQSIVRTGGACAVHVGWRSKLDTWEGRIRVAYWLNSDGEEGEVVLDESYRKVQERLARLKSNRDVNFNAARERLGEWLQANPDSVPEWFTEGLKHLSQWKAHARLAVFVLKWRENRFGGDEQIHEVLEAWRRQDRHLWTWHSNLQEKMKGRRREKYRIFAARLAAQYDVVVMDDFDLRAFADKASPEEGVDACSGLRNQAKIAAVGSLRQEIERAMKAAGKLAVRESSEGITRTCPFCEGEVASPPKADIMVVCGKCLKVYDQDWAACSNLLTRFAKVRQTGTSPC